MEQTPVASNGQGILEVNDLKTQFNTDDGIVNAVNGVSYVLQDGETMGMPGCGAQRFRYSEGVACA